VVVHRENHYMLCPKSCFDRSQQINFGPQPSENA
jgi:hypothetical protein